MTRLSSVSLCGEYLVDYGGDVYKDYSYRVAEHRACA